MKKLERITITKVKLLKFEEDLEIQHQMCGVELGYSHEVLDNDGALEFVKEYPTAKLRNFLAHQDLIEKFLALRPHLALLCEYENQDDYEVDTLGDVDFKKIFVTQVTLTGHDENAGVVIEGFRVLKGGDALKLATPNIKFESFEYEFGRELSDAIDELTNEALLCLTEKKRKVVQMDLFEEEPATDDEGDEGSESLFGNIPFENIKKGASRGA